jgi:hypothetical protein
MATMVTASVSLPYRERLQPPAWAAPAFGTLGVMWMVRRVRNGKPRPLWRKALAALNGVFTLLTVLRLVRRFANVAVEVEEESVRLRFGGIEKRLPASAVRDVRVAMYNPLRYLGWGYRVGLGGGRAFSQIGVARGVEITLDEDGHMQRYFVSSRAPEALASAVAYIAGAGVGAAT